MMDRDTLLRMGKDEKFGADWRVLAVIIANTLLPGDTTEASVSALSKATGLHDRTVKEVRARLVERGYLVSAGRNERGASLYCLTGGGWSNDHGGEMTTGGETATERVVVSPPPSPQYIIEETDTSRVVANSPSIGEGKKKPPKPKVTFDGKAFIVPEMQMTAWKEAHPGIDVESEIKKACAWFIADGQKKKALGRFVTNWLGRKTPCTPRPKASDDYELTGDSLAAAIECANLFGRAANG